MALNSVVTVEAFVRVTNYWCLLRDVRRLDVGQQAIPKSITQPEDRSAVVAQPVRGRPRSYTALSGLVGCRITFSTKVMKVQRTNW